VDGLVGYHNFEGFKIKWHLIPLCYLRQTCSPWKWISSLGLPYWVDLINYSLKLLTVFGGLGVKPPAAAKAYLW